MHWEQVFYAAAVAAMGATLLHLFYAWRVRQAEQTMGIAAGPEVAKLAKQSKQMRVVATVIVPAAFISLMAHGASSKPIAWRTYSSAQGAYTAQLPGEPETRDEAVDDGSGNMVTIHVAETELGPDGHYSIVEREGPALTYQAEDQRRLYEMDSHMVAAIKFNTYGFSNPYPEAWGEVACTELHARDPKKQDVEAVVRTWRTGSHQYSAIAVFKNGTRSKEIAQQFLSSIRPLGEYKKPGDNHSGIE